jgi:hypothetical protein
MQSYRFRRLASTAILKIFLPVAVSLFLTPHVWGQNSSTLQGIQTIKVDSLGSESGAVVMRQRIADRLEKSGHLKVVQSDSAADAVLRGTSNVWATGTISLDARSKSARQTIYQGYLSVELVGKGGETL